MAKRLLRSRTDSMVAGVMGGIGQRYGWDSTVVRVVFVLASVLSAAFPGILVYLVLWAVIPREDAGGRA